MVVSSTDKGKVAPFSVPFIVTSLGFMNLGACLFSVRRPAIAIDSVTIITDMKKLARKLGPLGQSTKSARKLQ